MFNNLFNNFSKALSYFAFILVFQISLFSINIAQANNPANSLPPSLTKQVIKPFTAEYTILRKSKPVGTGIRKLSYLDDHQVKYSYTTNIEWLIFNDVRSETSVFDLNHNQVVPKNYLFTREGTGKDKHYEWQYDIDNNVATDVKNSKNIAIDFPTHIQDSLSYHLQQRLDLIKKPKQKHFVYPVIRNSGAIKNYVYQYDGEEELLLPYGLVKAIRLKREVIEKKRITYVWFAPELNYLLVKLYQVKGGVQQFEAQLSTLDVSP
jgi:hypothetical protein